MTLSAAFTVEGNANPARHQVAYGSTVDLALLDTDGASSIVWSIMGCSDDSEPIPTITPSGNPSGKTASFVMPMDSGDTLGRTFLVRCIVSNQVRGADGAYEQDISYGVVGAVNSQGRLPIVPGEKNYRNATHGWAPEINELLNASGGGGGGGSGGGWTDDGSIVRLTTSGDAVAIGTASLSGTEKLRVIGSARFEQAAATAGNPKAFLVAGGGHTALTASAEIIDVDFALDRTVQRNTGAVTTSRAFVVRAPTYSFVGASTITDSATLAITGAPVAGTNATITNNYALWVQAGSVRFAGLGAGVVQASTTGVLSSGTLSIANGGTGLTSAGGTADRVLFTSNGTTFSVAQVTLASIVNLTGLSVLGRSASTSGVMAAITGTDGQALRVSGTTLGFGTLATAAYADNSVTLAKLATQAGLSVLVNATNSTAVPTALVAGTDGFVLQRSGTSLVWAAVPVASGSITYANIQDGTGLSVIGRATNTSGVNADIVAATDGHVLRRSGTSIGFGALDLSAAGTVGSSLLALVNIAGASGNTGKALISDGTNWAAGTNFGSNDLVTTGSIALDSSPATVGSLRGGASFRAVVRSGANNKDWFTWNQAADTFSFNDETNNGANRAASLLFNISNSGNFTVGSQGVTRLQLRGTGGVTWRFGTTTLEYDGSVSAPVFNQVTTSSGSGSAFTISAQDASATTGVAGGAMTLRAGDATGASGSRTGGALTLRSGTGATAPGTIQALAGTQSVFDYNVSHGNSATFGAASGASTWIDASATIHLACASNEIVQILTTGVRFLTNDLFYGSGQVNPTLSQTIDTSASVTGDTFTISAQDCSGTTAVTAGALTVRAGDATGASGTRVGGALTLRSGTGATTYGDLAIFGGNSATGVQLWGRRATVASNISLLLYDATANTNTGQLIVGTSSAGLDSVSVRSSSTIDLTAGAAVSFVTVSTSRMTVSSAGIQAVNASDFVSGGVGTGFRGITNTTIASSGTVVFHGSNNSYAAANSNGGDADFYAGDASGSAAFTFLGGNAIFRGGDASGANAGGSFTGGTATVRAGDATGASGTRLGGSLTLRSGTGGTRAGNIFLQVGSTAVFQSYASGDPGVNGETRINTAGSTMRLGASTGYQLLIATTGLTIVATTLQFENGQTPVVKQQDETSGTTGKLFTYSGQDVTTSNATTVGGARIDKAGDASGTGTGGRTGGAYTIRSGIGSTGSGTLADGDLTIQRGASAQIQLVKPSSGLVIGLVRTSAVTSTQMPANTGDGVIYVGNATTAPSTGNPVSGNILWAQNTTDGDSWLVKNPSGATWSLSPQRNWHRYYRSGHGTTNSTSSTTVATIDLGSLGNGGGSVKVYVCTRDASNSFGQQVYGFSFQTQGGTLSSGTTTPTSLYGSNSQIASVALAYPGSPNVDFKVTATDGVTYTHEILFEVTFHPNAA